jgi:hypothetical protein
MDLQSVIALVVAGLGIPVAVLRIVRELSRTSARERLLQDIEIRNALPPDSEAQKIFDNHVCLQARAICEAASGRRDPLGIVVAVTFFALGIGGGWVVVTGGGWWWLASPVVGGLLLFGVVGFVETVSKKERDERGNAV